MWRCVCDWLQSCGDFTFWSFTFEHEYARHKVVFVVDEVRRRTRSACITATPADVMPELVDYDSDTSSISSSSSQGVTLSLAPKDNPEKSGPQAGGDLGLAHNCDKLEPLFFFSLLFFSSPSPLSFPSLLLGER